jgi:Flp pilus assembly pilin Flp
MSFLRNLWRNKQGQDLIEYTLLMAFVALASAALFIGAGGSVKSIWTSTNNKLTAADKVAGHQTNVNIDIIGGGTGYVIVKDSNGAIVGSCGNFENCPMKVDGEETTLIAVKGQGSVFAGWEKVPCSDKTEEICRFNTIATEVKATARFERRQ